MIDVCSSAAFVAASEECPGPREDSADDEVRRTGQSINIGLRGAYHARKAATRYAAPAIEIAAEPKRENS